MMTFRMYVLFILRYKNYKKENLREGVAVQKNSVSSNANPSVMVTLQTTHSPHILNMYTYTYTHINTSSKKE